MVTRTATVKPVTAEQSPTGVPWESVLEAIFWDGPAGDAEDVLEGVVDDVRAEGHRVIDSQCAVADVERPDGFIGWLLYARKV